MTMNRRTTSLNVLAQRLAAVAAVLSLAACGSCNCSVPAFHAPAPGVTPLPPGVTPTPHPTPTATATPVGSTACSQGAGSIPLGPALAPFALLAGSTITNVGLTNVTFATGAVTAGVNDDLIGVSP